MEFYPKVKKYITDSFLKSSHARDIVHLDRTVHWLKELRPDADEALYIAAFAHDAERAFRDDEATNAIFRNKGMVNGDQVKYHSETGARIVSDFLRKEQAPSALVQRVSDLISKHEIGGTEDQNLLKDADSLSYFENQVDYFISKRVPELGREKVKEKFDWTYERISSEKAKQIAKSWYEAAIKKLGY